MKKLLDEINETQEIVRTLNWEVLIKKKKKKTYNLSVRLCHHS